MNTNNEPTSTIEEENVRIETPDGTCDAAFFYPTSGTFPGVILWADAFGLRPALRDMGRRLAGEGYAVLVPNPFYRAAPAETLALDPRTVSFQNEADRNRLRQLMSGVQAEGAAEKDAAAFVTFLDAQASVDTSRKIGVQGYCMGGALALRTAAAVPERIGAAASFHGGGLVSDRPDSPHRLVPKMKARIYVGVAANDDEREPEAKNILRAALDAANVPAEVDVYPALHGWCMPDFTIRDGQAIYNEPEAERAWGKLLALYQSAL